MFIISVFLAVASCTQGHWKDSFGAYLLRVLKAFFPGDNLLMIYPLQEMFETKLKYTLDLGFDLRKHLDFNKITTFYPNLCF